MPSGEIDIPNPDTTQPSPIKPPNLLPLIEINIATKFELKFIFKLLPLYILITY